MDTAPHWGRASRPTSAIPASEPGSHALSELRALVWDRLQQHLQLYSWDFFPICAMLRPLALPRRRLVRWLHKGHVNATLEKLRMPRHHWLKEVDQAPEKSTVRRLKDNYIRELGEVHTSMQDLFRSDKGAQSALLQLTVEQKQKDKAHQRELNNEALRIYRLLRPEAPRFFEEDAMLGMKARMNQITQEDNQADPRAAVARAEKMADPFKAHLPVISQKAFLLALESVDLETLWHLLGNDPEDLPGVEDPLRFHKLVGGLFNAFPLKKSPQEVPAFMERYWPTLRALLPEDCRTRRKHDVAGTGKGFSSCFELFDLDEKHVEAWLRGHLERVILNQRRYEQADQKMLRQAEEYYNFAEDFPYDDDPMPGLLADERNLDFPLEKAQEYMQLFLAALGASQRAKDLVWDLEEVGLRNWLKMDIKELEDNLPKGEVAQLIHATASKGGETSSRLYFDDDDVKVAKLTLAFAVESCDAF
eukprot:s1446_g4.t1